MGFVRVVNFLFLFLFFEGFMNFVHIVIFLLSLRGCLYFLFCRSMIFVCIFVVISDISGILLFFKKGVRSILKRVLDLHRYLRILRRV